MKKHLFYIVAFISVTGSLCAQGEIKLSGENKTGGTYTACSSIILTDKFSFSAVATGKSLVLKVSPSTCDPFAGKDIDPSTIKNQNYIRTKTFLKDDGSRYLDQIQYFDGLGRRVQTIQRGMTPSAKDLITYQEYDDFGRESKTWLPLNSSVATGAYRDPAAIITRANLEYKDSRAFIEPAYEASPLNRVLKQYGPGDAWKNNPVTTDYLTNNSTYPCILYTVGGTNVAPTLVKGNNYQDGQLYVTQLKDETGNTSYEFKDKLGQVVLTRQMNGTEKYDTYYVYDDFGNLTFVLPPLASTSADLNLYGYQYKYDARNRCIWKKIPGCEPIFYVYDQADRLVFTQDGEQRTKITDNKSEWIFNKYDAFGRLIISGIYRTGSSHQAMQDTYSVQVFKESIGSGNFGYTWNILPNIPVNDVLLINYYDDYEAMLKTNAYYKSNLDYNLQSGYGTKHSSAKGLLVGTRVKIISPDGKSTNTIEGQIATAMYYDYKGNVIQTKSTNHLGGIESEYIAYTFTGSPTQKLHVHTAKINNLETKQTELYTYTYDHVGRLLKTTHQLTDGTTVKPQVILAENTYDELGRLSSTTASNQVNLKTTYAYNIRSWASSITNAHFVENLGYNFNGNIATQEWRQAAKTRKYTFTYDNLSRLESAIYTGDGSFGTAYTYDKMGNLKTIQRNGLTAVSSHGVIDNLKLEYTGNQLKNIDDTAPYISLSTSADFKNYQTGTGIEYAFNKNGAMTMDLNKGIVSRSGTSLLDGISYNSLNLPLQMVINNKEVKAKNYYTYSANGTKLKVVYRFDPNGLMMPLLGTTPEKDGLRPKSTTDYVGNKIYEDGVLKMILTDNGYYDNIKKTYYFYIKDHLGNNRIVANSSASVIQSNQYYPFGMAFAEGDPDAHGVQDFKYNGKELDRTHGLNQYDYSARYYDPAYARFTTVDPHTENYYSWSPYAYVANNPMRFIDPDGKDPRQLAHWGKFFREAYNACTGIVTVGVQMAASISTNTATAGAHINAGSVDLIGVRDGVFTPSKNNPQTRKGVDVGVGIISASSIISETDQGKTTRTEKKDALVVLFSESYNTETVEINQTTGETSKTSKRGTQAANYTVRAAFILGVEINIDTEKAAKAIFNLLKTDDENKK